MEKMFGEPNAKFVQHAYRIGNAYPLHHFKQTVCKCAKGNRAYISENLLLAFEIEYIRYTHV
ncbi:MAG: hypothetical protein U0T72_03830 [Chitinophagales bacterium]